MPADGWKAWPESDVVAHGVGGALGSLWARRALTDAERDQTFTEALHLYDLMMRWYVHCGYEVREVPGGIIDERVVCVEQLVAGSF